MKQYRIRLGIDYYSAINYLNTLADELADNQTTIVDEPECHIVEKTYAQIKEKYAKLLKIPDIRERKNKCFEVVPTELEREIALAYVAAARLKDSEHTTKIVSNEDDNCNISHVTNKLKSEKAMVYWNRLINQQFVDSHYMLLKTTTRQQAMYIAETFAEKLGIKSKWKTFEVFWKIKNLAQEKQKMTETGKLPKRAEEIEKIFNN